MLRNLNIESLVAANEAGRARLERHVADLARDRGVEITLELELDARPGIHRIELRFEQKAIAVSVAKGMFLDTDEFFDLFVLPRIKAAIGELMAPH